MKVLRYLVGTKRKQCQLFILCAMLMIVGYFYWISSQWHGETRTREHQVQDNEDISKLLSNINSNIGLKTTTFVRPERSYTLKEKLFMKKTFAPTEMNRILSNDNKLSNGNVNDENLALKVSYNVHIFYYVWYGNPHTDGKYVHWNHEYLPHWDKNVAARYKKGAHTPPDDIGSDFYPELGCYSSSDDSTIRKHMGQIRASGAGVIVVSWYPPGKSDQQGIPVDRLMPKILDIASEYKLKVTIHIEPYKERNEQTVRDDAVYIHTQYANHPAFYKYKTKDNRYLPLLYIYDSYHTMPTEWANLLQEDGKYTIRNTPYDCVMIALMVEFTHKDYISVGGFDGFYTYFAVDGFTYGSRWSAWSKLKSFAIQTSSIFIPSVGPGYIDTSIRPWNYDNTRSRENGAYYKRSFQAALSVQPEIISVTSFNEWHEGTQIERAVPRSGLNGFKYKDYLPDEPDYYLKLTRSYVEKFETNL